MMEGSNCFSKKDIQIHTSGSSADLFRILMMLNMYRLYSILITFIRKCFVWFILIHSSIIIKSKEYKTFKYIETRNPAQVNIRAWERPPQWRDSYAQIIKWMRKKVQLWKVQACIAFFVPDLHEFYTGQILNVVQNVKDQNASIDKIPAGTLLIESHCASLNSEFQNCVASFWEKVLCKYTGTSGRFQIMLRKIETDSKDDNRNLRYNYP